MTRLLSGALASILAIALARSAFAAEAPPPAIGEGSTLQTGVTTIVRPNGFALVTFGTWGTPKQNEPVVAPSQTTNPIANERWHSTSGSSFRRAAYLPYVQAAEQRFGIPRGLLDALIWTESRYSPLALSKAGAVGLGQLMPPTAATLGVSNRYDARSNIMGAAHYLRQMLDQFGAVHLAVAAYNAGPGAVKSSKGIPLNNETPNYVRNLLYFWKHFTR